MDYRQWSIDRSVFVEPWTLPRSAVALSGKSPWAPTDLARSTACRLMVASTRTRRRCRTCCSRASTRSLQALTGVTARTAASRFCYWLTVGTSGISYVAAVIGVLLFTRRVLGPSWQALAVAASFALATCAVVYSRQLNPHIMLLGVTAWIIERGSTGRQAGRWRMEGASDSAWGCWPERPTRSTPPWAR